MKLALCLLFVALATATPAYYEPVPFTVQSAASQALKEFRAAFRKPGGVNIPASFEFKSQAVSNGFSTQDVCTNYQITAACQTAGAALGQAFVGCSAFQTAAMFFNDSTTSISQSDVDSYCSAACKLDFESKLQTLVSTCTALDLYCAHQANPTFDLVGLVFVLKLPCIEYNGEYCLPHFKDLQETFSPTGYQPTQNDLTRLCVPCQYIFLAELAKFADIRFLEILTFVDLVCTQDGSTFCYLESKAIDALPQVTTQDNITRIDRICSTTCLQRIVIKEAIALAVFDPLAIATRLAIDGAIVFLDGMCSVNAAGTPCGELAVNVGDRLQAAVAAGCPILLNSCNTGCATNAQDFSTNYGCCIARFAQIEDIYKPAGSVGEWDRIINFLQGQCKVSVEPPCPGAGKKIAGEIIVNNLKFASWWALTTAQQDAFIAKFVYDLANNIGALPDNINITASDQMVQTSGGLFSLMATTDPTSLAFNVEITSDSTSQITSFSTSLQNGITQGSVVLTNTNTGYGQNNYATNGFDVRHDPSDGFSIAAQSAVAVVNVAAAAGLVPSLSVLLAAILAVIALF